MRSFILMTFKCCSRSYGVCFLLKMLLMHRKNTNYTINLLVGTLDSHFSTSSSALLSWTGCGWSVLPQRRRLMSFIAVGRAKLDISPRFQTLYSSLLPPVFKCLFMILRSCLAPVQKSVFADYSLEFTVMSNLFPPCFLVYRHGSRGMATSLLQTPECQCCVLPESCSLLSLPCSAATA